MIRRHRLSLQALGLLLLAFAAGPASAQIKRPEKADLHLEADRTAYEAGTTARIAAVVKIEAGWHVNSHKPTFDYLIPTVLDLDLPAGWPDETVQYPVAGMQTFAFAEQPLAVYDGQVLIRAELRIPPEAKAGTFPLRGALEYQACNDSQCLPPVTTEAHLSLHIGPEGKGIESAAFSGSAGDTGDSSGDSSAAAGAGAAPSQAGPGIVWILLIALLGGLILNAMPCVLPVLSLKVFGMVRSAGHGRSEVVRGSLATAAGILASFWALALAAIAARAAGSAVGWGIQFQRPGFVAFLAVVVVLFCLNLWGLFEIHLPQRLARVGNIGIGGSGVPREGAAGHFASGLFATLMATPCSAPFLGTAISFALAQPSLVILAVFTAVGLGMALPYLLLAVAPGTARLLPRPGAWMETVRGAMGFLLAASAVWLFYVLSAQVSPERVAALQLGLLGLGLFTWLRHRGPSGAGFRRAAGIGMAAAVIAVLTLASWRGGEAIPGSRQAEGPATKLISWQDFDRGRAESLAADGQLVFVDVTADWCFTCKFNEKLILETPEIAGVFAETGVVPMKADWTNRNDEIAKFLAEHGRYGIPFYLLYGPGGEPQAFSELLSKEKLLAAVCAARPAPAASSGACA